MMTSLKPTSLLCVYIVLTTASGMAPEPSFDVPLVNVTVVAGQSIVLQCSIDNLGHFKVAWLDQNSFPLTYEERSVIDDPRFSVVRPYLKEWNLLISDVRSSDSGSYRCTVNTNPVRSKITTLHVKVPPQIIDHLSSSDITVREGDSVRLTCNATGIPRPEVTWLRRSWPNSVERLGVVGETLLVINASRHRGDLYECIADNGVPPAFSRQIKVTVQYPPEISVPNRRIGQKLGGEVVLECVIAAVPTASHYWTRDSLPIAMSSKHVTDEYDELDGRVTLRINIRNLQLTDYGDYQCVAGNQLGRTQKTVTLYEYRDAVAANHVRPSTATSTRSTTKLTTTTISNHWAAVQYASSRDHGRQIEADQYGYGYSSAASATVAYVCVSHGITLTLLASLFTVKHVNFLTQNI